MFIPTFSRVGQQRMKCAVFKKNDAKSPINNDTEFSSCSYESKHIKWQSFSISNDWTYYYIRTAFIQYFLYNCKSSLSANFYC